MNDWPYLKLAEVTTKVGSGATPRGGKTSYKEVGIPLIRSMNVHSDGFRYGGLAHIDESQARALDAVEVRASDVLLNITGASIGRVAVAPTRLDGARVNQHVCIIRPKPQLDPSFLRWFLASPGQQKLIMDVQSGATRQALTKDKILNLEVPIPPIATQHRIVAEIEKQFSRLDEAVANFKRVKANLRRYRATVLKAAVEGRLVPTEAELARREGRSYETGEQLLARILAERRAAWENQAAPIRKKKYVKPQPPDTSGLLELPEGWAGATIEQVVSESLIGIDRGRYQQNTKAIGVPYVKMNNVTIYGRVTIEDLVYVPASNEERDRFALNEGDILFNTRNSRELVGKVGLVRHVPIGAIYNNNLMRLRLSHGMIPAFVCAQMCSEGFRRRMELVKKATTNVAAVYAKDLFPLQLALPPIAEQQRIVTEVERRLSVADESEAQVNAGLRRAEVLRQAILKQAFEGNLG